jgi:hypothetical protein
MTVRGPFAGSAAAVARVHALLPPAGPLRRYTVISLVDATGTGMFLAVSVLFFTRFAGLSAGSVALGLSVAGLAAMIGAVPLGSLGDRFGHRRVWVLLTVVQSVVFAAYPLVRTFPEFVALAGALPSPTASPARPRSVLRDRRYLTVCVLNGLLMTYGAILTVGLPLWIVRRTHAPAWTVAGTFLVSTLLVVTLQVRASRGLDTVPGAARGAWKAGALLLASCLVLGSTRVLPAPGAIIVLGVGCVLLALAEMLQSAVAWGLSYGLAPEDRQGEYLGAFAMGTRIYDSLGPILVTSMILGLGQLGWALLGLLYAGLAASLSAAACWAARALPAAPGTAGREASRVLE